MFKITTPKAGSNDRCQSALLSTSKLQSESPRERQGGAMSRTGSAPPEACCCWAALAAPPAPPHVAPLTASCELPLVHLHMASCSGTRSEGSSSWHLLIPPLKRTSNFRRQLCPPNKVFSSPGLAYPFSKVDKTTVVNSFFPRQQNPSDELWEGHSSTGNPPGAQTKGIFLAGVRDNQGILSRGQYSETALAFPRVR